MTPNRDYVYEATVVPGGICIAGQLIPCADPELGLQIVGDGWAAWAEALGGWCWRPPGLRLALTLPAGVPVADGWVSLSSVSRQPRTLDPGPCMRTEDQEG